MFQYTLSSADNVVYIKTFLPSIKSSQEVSMFNWFFKMIHKFCFVAMNNILNLQLKIWRTSFYINPFHATGSFLHSLETS